MQLKITSIIDDETEYILKQPFILNDGEALYFEGGRIMLIERFEPDKEKKHGISDEEADRIAKSLLKKRSGGDCILPS